MNSSRTTIILIILALVILAAVGYLLFFKDQDLSTITAQGGKLSGVETTFLNLTSRLEPVAFDTAILSDPRFQSLQNINTAIVPENAGRVNPFAPITGATTAP